MVFEDQPVAASFFVVACVGGRISPNISSPAQLHQLVLGSESEQINKGC
jgi:hypothetical protein